MPVAQSGGVSIRYQSVGEGPTVILHHGGGFRLESWTLAGSLLGRLARERLPGGLLRCAR